MFLLPRLILLFLSTSFLAYGADLGTLLASPWLRDAEDKPVLLPDLGRKVLMLVYADPEAGDQTDRLSEEVKRKNFPKDRFRGLGVANLKDTWKPNSLIRLMIRRKIEQFHSIILTDPDGTLPKSWNLGNCDDQAVVLVLDAGGVLRFQHRGTVSAERAAEITAIIAGLLFDAGKTNPAPGP